MTGIEEWEEVISAAAQLQHLVPGCVLVGGSAAAIHAKHRLSMDADHVLTDLSERFEDPNKSRIAANQGLVNYHS